MLRGVLWSSLVRKLNPGPAAAAATLTFLLAHVPEIRGYWPAWAMVSAVGLAAVCLRVRGESLAPPVALHASYNACLVAAVYLGAA